MTKLVAALFALTASLLTAPATGLADEAVWSQLRSGGFVIFIRHALTDPGAGDPPGFKLGDCRTERNLNAAGRAEAKRLGEAFRREKIPVAQVLSSEWCPASRAS
jgi:hypothetical protein